MSGLRVALATCSELPGWEIDDAPLQDALSAIGVAYDTPVWDDSTVEWDRYDAILIRTTWDYHQKHAAFVRWASRVAEVSRLFNPASVIVWNTDKQYLRELEGQGIPLAETEWLDAGDTVDVGALVHGRSWTRGFIKPLVGANASDTLRFNGDPEGVAAAQSHVDSLLPTQALMVQPYLESVETEGEFSAFFVDGVHTHSVQKIPVPGDYRVQDDWGAKDFPVELSASDVQLAHNVVKQAEKLVAGLDAPLLYARVDFLRNMQGNLVLNELELVEPSLFFRHSGAAAVALAEALQRRAMS